MSEYLKPALFTMTPFLGAAYGRKITFDNMKWYDTVAKPSWRPPKWVFGPVWSVLYASMGYASWLIYRDCGEVITAESGLPLYLLQLALNWSWTPIFFGKHKLGLGFANLAACTASVCATTFYFGRINTTASRLLYPYIAWLSFASMLNFWIWRNNPSSPGSYAEIKEE